jgi:hypothetical protein
MRTVWLSAGVLGLSGWLASSVPSVSGCVMPTSGDDAGKVSMIPVTGDSGTLSPSATGTGCTELTTSVTLCTGVSDCPDVSVNQSVYPECGFLVQDSAVYLACLCTSYLCLIGQGQPTTCDEAATLLQASNEGTVCGEANNNQCAAISGGTTTGDASTDATDSDAGSGCTMDCQSMCSGVPDCLTACGC